MKPPLSYAPVFGLLGATVLGILTGCIAPGSAVLIWTAVGCAFLLFAGFIILKKHYPAICALFFGIGCLSTAYALPAPAPPYAVDGYPHKFTGTVVDMTCTQNAQRATITVHLVDNTEVRPFKCLLTIGDIEPELHPGDSVTAICPADATEDRRGTGSLEPDRFYYFARGIGADGFCTSKDISVSGHSRSLRFLPSRLRDRLAEMIVASPLSSESQDFLLATVLGLRGELPADLRADFRQLGISHILCVSGYHVGLVAWLISVCLLPLGGLGENLGRLRHIPAIMLIWLYILICGAQPSAVRAGVMITAYLLARLLQRGNFPYNSLALAALVILLFNPYWLFDGGFLLSFGAVLGILLFADALNPFGRRQHRAYVLCSWMCLPVAAILGTLPATLLIFHSFPLYFLPANMIVALFFPLMIALAGSALVLWHTGLHYSILGAPADFLFSQMQGLCSHAAELSSSMTLVPSPFGIAGLTLSLLALAIALRLEKRRHKAAAALAAVLVGALCVVLPVKPATPGACVGTYRGHIVMMFHSGENGLIYSPSVQSGDFRGCSGYLVGLGCDTPGVCDTVPRLSWPGLENFSPGLLVLPGKSVVYGPVRVIPRNALLLVHRDYLPDLTEISRLRPEQVIISGTITVKRRRQYEEICRELDVPARFLPAARYMEL